jgi:hypothetical protein
MTLAVVVAMAAVVEEEDGIQWHSRAHVAAVGNTGPHSERWVLPPLPYSFGRTRAALPQRSSTAMIRA